MGAPTKRPTQRDGSRLQSTLQSTCIISSRHPKERWATPPCPQPACLHHRHLFGPVRNCPQPACLHHRHLFGPVRNVIRGCVIRGVRNGGAQPGPRARAPRRPALRSMLHPVAFRYGGQTKAVNRAAVVDTCRGAAVDTCVLLLGALHRIAHRVVVVSIALAVDHLGVLAQAVQHQCQRRLVPGAVGAGRGACQSVWQLQTIRPSIIDYQL